MQHPTTKAAVAAASTRLHNYHVNIDIFLLLIMNLHAQPASLVHTISGMIGESVIKTRRMEKKRNKKKIKERERVLESRDRK